MIFGTYIVVAIVCAILFYIVGRRHGLGAEGIIYGLLTGPFAILILIFLKPNGTADVQPSASASPSPKPLPNSDKLLIAAIRSVQEDVKAIYKCLRLIRYTTVYKLYEEETEAIKGEYTLLEIYELYRRGVITENMRIKDGEDLKCLYLCDFWSIIYN